MAKNMFPMKSGGGLLSKVVGLLVLAAVLTLMVKHPVEAAGFVHAAGQLAGGLVDGISTFLQIVVR